MTSYQQISYLLNITPFPYCGWCIDDGRILVTAGERRYFIDFYKISFHTPQLRKVKRKQVKNCNMMLVNLWNWFFSPNKFLLIFEKSKKSNTNLLFLNRIHKNETAMNMRMEKISVINGWRGIEKEQVFIPDLVLSFTENWLKIHMSINCKKNEQKKFFRARTTTNVNLFKFMFSTSLDGFTYMHV